MRNYHCDRLRHSAFQMTAMLGHKLRNPEKGLEFRLSGSIHTMKTDAYFVRGIHVRIGVPDPLDKTGAIRRERDRELAFKQMADLFFTAPGAATVSFLVEHDAGFFHQAQLRGSFRQHAVPYQVVVVPPVVQRYEIDLRREELHVGTVSES